MDGDAVDGVSPPFGQRLPSVRTPLPGPESRRQVDVLAQHECPAVTARRARRAAVLGAADDDPVVWEAALGANVRDVDGNELVDLTSGFGVALIGHAHPEVVAAAAGQASVLPHASGDAWPDRSRIAFLAALARVAPPGLDVALLGLSGSDAVEAAVKTASLATGRTRVIAFEGGYHGLSLGSLPLQGYKAAFSDPFRGLLRQVVRHLPFGCSVSVLREALADGEVGLVMVEPVLGRGGMRPAPAGWLADVAATARQAGALVAFDEIQTGCGRTGDLFAGPAAGVVPDLMCIGKALGGGFPLSACLGTREVMNRWGASKGEALHTQTFLGHPVGCAAATAVLGILEQQDVPGRVRIVGQRLQSRLRERGYPVRGRGLMLGVELGPGRGLGATRALLRRGYLTLPAGPDASVLGLTPPVCISEAQLDGFVEALTAVVSP